MVYGKALFAAGILILMAVRPRGLRMRVSKILFMTLFLLILVAGQVEAADRVTEGNVIKEHPGFGSTIGNYTFDCSDNAFDNSDLSAKKATDIEHVLPVVEEVNLQSGRVANGPFLYF